MRSWEVPEPEKLLAWIEDNQELLRGEPLLLVERLASQDCHQQHSRNSDTSFSFQKLNKSPKAIRLHAKVHKEAALWVSLKELPDNITNR
jgi:hypothetical protein